MWVRSAASEEPANRARTISARQRPGERARYAPFSPSLPTSSPPAFSPAGTRGAARAERKIARVLRASTGRHIAQRRGDLVDAGLAQLGAAGLERGAHRAQVHGRRAAAAADDAR